MENKDTQKNIRNQIYACITQSLEDIMAIDTQKREIPVDSSRINNVMESMIESIILLLGIRKKELPIEKTSIMYTVYVSEKNDTVYMSEDVFLELVHMMPCYIAESLLTWSDLWSAFNDGNSLALKKIEDTMQIKYKAW